MPWLLTGFIRLKGLTYQCTSTHIDRYTLSITHTHVHTQRLTHIHGNTHTHSPTGIHTHLVESVKAEWEMHHAALVERLSLGEWVCTAASLQRIRIQLWAVIVCRYAGGVLCCVSPPLSISCPLALSLFTFLCCSIYLSLALFFSPSLFLSLSLLLSLCFITST